jgi:N-acyl-D-amino-acid deacylase
MEILLENGLVVDGTGAPPRNASVLVRDGKIADIISAHEELPHSASLDCSGHVIAPGFVDVHTHSDYEILQRRSNKVLQGVTTEIVGNCGYSLFPMRGGTGHLDAGSIFENFTSLNMLTAGDYFAAVETAKPLLNVASLTGHSALRSHVMGMDRRPPSSAELKQMECLLDQSLAEGSIGFSTGLNCLPSSFAEFEELASLCRVLMPRRAYYTTHMRDYKFQVVEAVEEAIRLSEVTEVPVQLSHLQVVGKKAWHHLDTVLETVDSAITRGINIGMDAYPYMAGSCSLVQLLPQWSQDGGLLKLLERLASSAESDRIARETEDYMSNTWDDIVIAGVKRGSKGRLVGKTVSQIADDRCSSPRNTVMDLLREEECQVLMISFNSCDENLRKVLTHPLTSIGSDSFAAEGLSHPRTFGTYPTFIGRYARDLGWMPIEQAIAKTSALPANRFGLRGRGSIAVHNWADLVVFDAARIGSKADYSHPADPPTGIRYVLVNGQIVVRDGELTGVCPGVALRN